MAKPADLLQGTLDMLILKAVSLGPLHGYGVLLRIRQISKQRLEIQQGSLYPALYRLEHQGLLAGEWGESENKRRRQGAATWLSTRTPRHRAKGSVTTLRHQPDRAQDRTARQKAEAA